MVKLPYLAPVFPTHFGSELRLDVGAQFGDGAAEIANVAAYFSLALKAENSAQAITQRYGKSKLWVGVITLLIAVARVCANVIFVVLLPLSKSLKMLIAIACAPFTKFGGSTFLVFFSKPFMRKLCSFGSGIDASLFSSTSETKTINSASFFDVTPQTRSAGVVAQQSKCFCVLSRNNIHKAILEGVSNGSNFSLRRKSHARLGTRWRESNPTHDESGGNIARIAHFDKRQ